MSTGTNGGQESHVQLSRAGALGPEWTPPVPRYRLTLTITGNTLDEIERELVVQTRGGFLLDSGYMRRDFWEIVTGRYISVMEHVNPEMTPERYDAELDAWWAGVDVAPLAPVLRKSMRDWLSALSDTDTYGYTPTPWEVERVAEPDEEAPTPERPAGPVTDVKPTFVDDVDPATLADLLQLVQEGQREVTVDEIAAWDKDTRCDVADWASALHLLASDNDDVEVPEMPEVLRPVPDVADEDGD